MNKTFWLPKNDKSITFSWHWQHWRLWYVKDNGAKKSRKEDTCYDLNIRLGCFQFSYTNWNFQNN